jgi:exosortase
MPQLKLSAASLRARPHIPFAALVLASIALFWVPLGQWLSLSLGNQRYTQLAAIPLISAFFFYLERTRIFSGVKPARRLGFALVGTALALSALLALSIVHVSADSRLSALMLAIVLVWIAGFIGCYGLGTFRAGLFPVLLLILMVPIPFHLMDQIIAFLQRGSAEATAALFRLAGVPVFRNGVSFELPVVGIDIAPECSSIHSGWALFITGLIVGHLFLRSIWAKTGLAIVTIPIAMFTNAVRIVTIWYLGTHVNTGFLHGKLHRDGGILFSLISLAILISLLWVLHKLELHGSTKRQLSLQ